MKEAMSSHIKVQKSDIGKGDTVLLHIPSADRGKMDRKHYTQSDSISRPTVSRLKWPTYRDDRLIENHVI
jgi:hypothetical protein